MDLISEVGKQLSYHGKDVQVQKARRATLRIGDPSIAPSVSFSGDATAVAQAGVDKKKDVSEGLDTAEFMSSAFAAQAAAKFDNMDRDGNGYLSKKEVYSAMRLENPKLTAKDVKALFKKYDKNKGSGIDRHEFLDMMADANVMEPGSGLDWLAEKEIIDEDPELIALMKTDMDAFLHTKVVPAMKKSEKIISALCKKDDEFLDVLENSEKLTSPDNAEYIAALKGTSVAEEMRLEEVRKAQEHNDKMEIFCGKLLSILNGPKALVIVLTVVFFAIIVLMIQLVGETNSALNVMDFLITFFFTIELVVKGACHVYVHKEVDTFLLDIMNFIDFAVVMIDILFIYVEHRGDGEGSRSGGFVKALRLARAARLFRLLRIRKLLEVTEKHMSMGDAMKDPRAIAVTFDRLLERMVLYLRENSLDSDKTDTLATVMHVLNLHMGRAHRMLDVQKIEEAALIEDVSVEEMLENKKEEFLRIQEHIGIECGCVNVLLNTISHTKSGAVMEDAIDTLRQLLLGGNRTIQAACVDTLTDNGSDALGPAFFFKIRELLREAIVKLREYRKIRKANPERAKTLQEGVLSCIKIMGLMKEMCEGHYKPNQNLLRKQPHAKSTNLVEESMELFCIVAKSLPSVRKWDDVEANVGIAAMILMVELCQGPCSENQTIFAENGKCIDGCLCVVTANLRSVKDARLKLKLESVCMVLLSSILENGSHGVILAVKDLVPVAILDDRATKVAGKLDWLKKMGKAFRDKFLDVLNAEAQSILALKEAFKEIDDDEMGALVEVVGGVRGDDNDEEKDGEECGRKKKEKPALTLRSVEVFWHGKCQKVFFNAKLTSLSGASKRRFIEECDLGSQEARIKEMVKACDDLNDEMEYQDRLKDFYIFQWFSKNFLTLKR